MQILTRVYRGGHLESFHTGSIAVVSSTGRLLAFAGDPSFATCLRSASKPFQAIPLLEYGGVDEYDLSGEEIALTCGSHGGEPFHVSTAAALLRKGEFDESDLLCGAHIPYDEKAAADLRAAGEEPSALHSNCSGKHAGMLLASQAMDAPTANYIEELHPIQILSRSTLADFAGVAAADIATSIDGCSIPALHLTMYRTALAYARLMATSQGSASPGALERYVTSAAHIVDSMTTYSEYVAGSWSITTALMQSFDGRLLAKEGAEGFYAMALSPELAATLTDRLRLSDDGAIGIALKIHDGSIARARNPVIVKTLQSIGIDTSSLTELEPYLDPSILNVVGTRVGEVRAEFDLEVL